MIFTHLTGRHFVFGFILALGSAAQATIAEQQARLLAFENKGKECAVEKGINKTDSNQMTKAEQQIMAQCLNAKGYSNQQIQSLNTELQDMKELQAFDTAVTSCESTTGVSAASAMAPHRGKGGNRSQGVMLGCLGGHGYTDKNQVVQLANELEAFKKQQQREAGEEFMKTCMEEKGHQTVQTSRKFYKTTEETEQNARYECQQAAKNAGIPTPASEQVNRGNQSSVSAGKGGGYSTSSRAPASSTVSKGGRGLSESSSNSATQSRGKGR